MILDRDVFYLNKIYKVTRCYQSEIQESDKIEHKVDGSQYSHIHISRCRIPVDIFKVEISPQFCFIKRQSLRSVPSWNFPLWAKAEMTNIIEDDVKTSLPTSISPHHRYPVLSCCSGSPQLNILGSTRHPSNSPERPH